MTIHLYIKTHTVTGLKYFGKTTKSDPYKYTGSGKYWKSHLKKHGFDYSTEIVGSFENVDECQTFALHFSKEHDIVNSDKWANLQEENGLDGAPPGHVGHKFTNEQLKKISASSKSRWEDLDYRLKTISMQLLSWTDERRVAQSNRLSGVLRPEHSKKMKVTMSSLDHKQRMSKYFSEMERTKEHCKNISSALSGKPKTDEHKLKLGGPKLRCCRLSDMKETTVNMLNREPTPRICRLSDKKEMDIINFKKYQSF